MNSIADNLKKLRQTITTQCQHIGRGDLPRLIAVSKRRSISDIQAAIDAGQTDFGESYVQEAVPKILALKEFNLTWHFIGPIQSNKTRLIAQHFDWVHSLDRATIAQRLNDQRPENLPRLQVCIQVNIDEEPQKSGVRLDQLAELVDMTNNLPRLQLRGLMTILKESNHTILQRASFAKLREVAQSFNMAEFSMGMSNDFSAAIMEGATMLRVGAIIFN